MIGVDPHKASHPAVTLDDRELTLGKVRVGASGRQAEQLLSPATTLRHDDGVVVAFDTVAWLATQVQRRAHPH